MTCSHHEIRRQLAGQYQTHRSEAGVVQRPVPTSLSAGLWSPAIAMGFLGIFLFSALAGIIVLLRVIL